MWPKMKNENQESPIKHTRAGEMPDASFLGRQKQRFESDAAILSDPAIKKGYLVPMVMGVALYGAWTLLRRTKVL